MPVSGVGIPSVSQIEWIYYLLAALGALLLLGKHVVKGIMRSLKWAERLDEGMRTIQVVKDNHLPHIEFYLTKICDKLEIDYKPLEAKVEASSNNEEVQDL